VWVVVVVVVLRVVQQGRCCCSLMLLGFWRDVFEVWVVVFRVVQQGDGGAQVGGGEAHVRGAVEQELGRVQHAHEPDRRRHIRLVRVMTMMMMMVTMMMMMQL
jgi:hypothetical protein